MSVGLELINVTKKEKITYLHLQVNTKREIAGNPVSSTITAWYFINNCGDEIGFVPDHCYENNWPYKNISWEDIQNYKDITDDIINELIENKIIADMGKEELFEDEPDIYLRRLKNMWL